MVQTYVLSVVVRQPHRSGHFMKEEVSKMVQMEDNDMRAEYDFRGGVRG